MRAPRSEPDRSPLPPCRRSDSPADLVPLTRRKTHQELEEYIGKSRGVCAAINTELGVVPPASDTAVYSITAQKALASHVGEGNLGPCRLPLTSAHHRPSYSTPTSRLPPAKHSDHALRRRRGLIKARMQWETRVHHTYTTCALY